MYCSLQDYYTSLVLDQPDSIQAFLKMNGLLDYEKALVWIEGADWGVFLKGYRNNCKINAVGLFSRLCQRYKMHQFQTELVFPMQRPQNQIQEKEPQQEPQLDEIVVEEVEAPQSIFQKDVLPIEQQFEVSTSVCPKVSDVGKELFSQWRDRLPEWYMQVLKQNGLDSFEKFVEEIRKPTFSCQYIKFCRQKTIDELRKMAAVLIWIYLQLGCNVDKSNETTGFLLSPISDSGLSIRAVNCLESIDVVAIKDLLPLCYDVLLSMRNCGKKTVSEIEMFVASVKKKYSIPETITIELVVGFQTQKSSKQDVTCRLSQLGTLDMIIPEIVGMFAQWKKHLSARSNQILMENGFTNIVNFVEETQKSTFSYKDLIIDGQECPDELAVLASFLTPQPENISESYDNADSILKSMISGFELSARAKNCLRSLKVNTIEDLLSLNHRTLLSVQNCGKNTIFEIVSFIASMRRAFSEGVFDQGVKVANQILLYISEEDYKLAKHFKNEYGHWPMMFVLYRYVFNSLLSRQELAVFEDKFGIQNNQSLDGLTKERIRQIFVQILRKLQHSSTLRQLCEYEDWDLYYVNNIPMPTFDDGGENDAWLKIENMVSRERVFIESWVRERTISELENNKYEELLSHFGLYTFKVFLQFFGHLPLWIDKPKNTLVPYFPQTQKELFDPLSPIVIDKRFVFFKFNKALAETGRLQKVKTENDVILSIEKYFVDNEDYWIKSALLSNVDKTTLVSILKELLSEICGANVVDGNLILKANKVDFSEKLNDILTIAGTRLHRDELFKRLKFFCQEKDFIFNYTDASQITPFLSRDPRIISYGKSSCWGLKEWGESVGSIRELALYYVKESKEPILIDDLAKLIMENRPDSNEKSIMSIIRQTVSAGELLLFYGDYIGNPEAKYSNHYIIMPQTFDEWLYAFKEYVINNKRYPLVTSQGFEGYLYRWYNKAKQLIDLSADEILKIDALEKEIELYPHNILEYNFLHNCNIYKKFVEGNKRMLNINDDSKLYHWFYIASRDYSKYNDNRNKYFSQLLQFLSSELY